MQVQVLWLMVMVMAMEVVLIIAHLSASDGHLKIKALTRILYLELDLIGSEDTLVLKYNGDLGLSMQELIILCLYHLCTFTINGTSGGVDFEKMYYKQIFYVERMDCCNK